MIRAFHDPAIHRWHVRRVGSVDQAHALITEWVETWAVESEDHWALADVAISSLLGSDGSAEVVYWMVPNARGRGLRADAVMALSHWEFDVTGCQRLSNPAFCRVAGNPGFTVEGVLRDAARHADGWHDMCLHGRLVTDS